VIIATAGHIDHGKTTLVKALTGVDTDRLPEEKARGISIDLGFAYWKTPHNDTIGFVDVPGHERFVRNMLAGVCGIDYVMLIVAADDGVMPQTVEHLHIVDLLAIGRGICVITKTDRIGADRVAEVAASVRALLAPTRLAGINVLPVSAVSGEGVDKLREVLAASAKEHGQREHAGRNLRYAIDRVFTVAGSGTVVTGTVFNGSVTVGDKLMLSPDGLEVRVRGIELEARGNVTRELEIIGAFSKLDPKVTKSNDGFVGNYLPNTALQQAALWTKYTFYDGPLAGLGIGGGVRYVGQSYGNNANTILIPDYTLFDATVSFDFKYLRPDLKGWSAQINATNLTNKYYVSSCLTALAYCGLGSARTVLGTLKYAWN